MALLLASLVFAFVGGLIALAMPCCFSVLLPSYFASAFKRRSAILGMTLVFAAGIAAIILPITLLANELGQFIQSRHEVFFVAGGFLMVLLGLLSFWGKSIIPQIRLPVNLQRSDAAGVFTLGVFSGIATSCCAPVLAGIIVLSALSASTASTLLVGLFYVAGMVAPLLAAGLLWDRSGGRSKKLLMGKLLRFRLLGRPVAIHSSNLVAGIMFILMGVATIILGLTGTMIAAPGADAIGVYQLQFENALDTWASTILGAIILWGLVALLVVSAFILIPRGLRRKATAAEEPPEDAPHD